MTYNVEIRRNADGVVETFRDDDMWSDSHHYLWSEGNYGCDCNRHIFFCQAGKKEAAADCPCGEIAYSLRCVSDGGIVLYQDNRWAKNSSNG